MSNADDQLRDVLSGYEKFLTDKGLATPKHRSYLVRWVQQFLYFAGTHPGYTFEQTLDLFLSQIGERVGIKPWQIQQAAIAGSFAVLLLSHSPCPPLVRNSCKGRLHRTFERGMWSHNQKVGICCILLYFSVHTPTVWVQRTRRGLRTH